MNDLFTNEDLSKPENRINVAIFGMMTVPEFADWLRERLNLPPGAVLYPPLNTANDSGAGRPDFAVRAVTTGEPIAYIEVECRRDEEQMARFRRMFPAKRVLALWGRPGPGCDLSLEEMSSFLAGASGWNPPQVRVNAEHLRKLIDDALSSGSTSAKRASVGDEMWESPFVLGLREALGSGISRYLPGDGDIRAGEIRLDTTDTTDNKAFSVRVHSPRATRKNVSILNRSAGRPEIRFSSKAWLDYYLEESHAESVRELTALVTELGGDMQQAWKGGVSRVGARPRSNYTTPVRLEDAESNVRRIAALVARLASRPTAPVNPP